MERRGKLDQIQGQEVVVLAVMSVGRVSLSRENEAGAVGGRKSIFSMLTYGTLFCFWL